MLGSDADNIFEFQEVDDEGLSDASSEDPTEPVHTGAVEPYAFDPQYTAEELREIEAQRNEEVNRGREIETHCSCQNCPREPITGKCCIENWPPNVRPSGCLANTEEFHTLKSRAHLYVLHFEVNAGRMQDPEKDPENK